jgi:hypothetical protein
MNRNKLKTYAPEARRDFIQAMTDRAALYGLTASKTEPAVVRGDVAVIAGRDYPRAIAEKRNKLEARVERDGFEETMEALAYTWFNRLVAIRFMEVNGYLDHGYRVLSHPDGKQTPEILEQAEHVELPGLKKGRAIDLKLEGNKESELFRLLLTAQCNALHKAMPFLFERIDDETELLLPDNLLHSDSLIRKLVDGIDDDDWKEVEVIGWLYQFYISEKKEEVIGKVVASADIPAATQLFTPNWIVKYLVQNTLGRQWLATYPNSALRAQMEYYIEPAAQTPEVIEQIKSITPASLDPEVLTMLDPACGSCHILVEGYDLFKAIYLERGYRVRDIPALILQKNLFGLEIDDRAAQLGAFALMMKARADDRRIFETEVRPNILAFAESKHLRAAAVLEALNAPLRLEGAVPEYLFEEITDTEVPLLSRKTAAKTSQIPQEAITALLGIFQNARTLGSLIRVPSTLSEHLTAIGNKLKEIDQLGDLTHRAAHDLIPLLHQARWLAQQFDIVVANPPYMGAKGMNPCLREFAQNVFPAAKAQLFSMFLERGFAFAKPKTGWTSMVTLDNWLSASSYEEFRKNTLETQTLHSLLHMPYEGRGKTTMGISFGTTATVFRGQHVSGYKSHCAYAKYSDLDDDGCPTSFPPENDRLGARCLDAAFNISGHPILYWASEQVLKLFAGRTSVGESVDTREGMTTADNDRFLRLWYEVPSENIGFGCKSSTDADATKKRWFPYVKGGDYRKWSGNTLNVVDWEDDGCRIKANTDPSSGRIRSHNYNGNFAFQPGITWTGLSSSRLSVRYVNAGFMFDTKGPMAFSKNGGADVLAMAVLNSVVGFHLMKMLAPTLDFKLGHIMSVPCEMSAEGARVVSKNAKMCVELSSEEWDCYETSWGFNRIPLLDSPTSLIGNGVATWSSRLETMRARLSTLENENNKIILKEYGLADELSDEIEANDITLGRASDQDAVENLASYAIGCMMGRYSLDRAGLVYAANRGADFDQSIYGSFEADADGIMPVLESDWGFADDVGRRFEEFVGEAWPKESLEENLRFVAYALSSTSSEAPRDRIRRYFSVSFFKRHLVAYKKRPIYWMFTSGKERAFQCLVYLHRYNEGTLARMRTEYVIPLQGRMVTRVDEIESEKAQSTSTSLRKKLQKEQDDLKRKNAELRVFDEKLKHFCGPKEIQAPTSSMRHFRP